MLRLPMCLALFPVLALAQPLTLDRGHLKLRSDTASFPSDSLFRDPAGAVAFTGAGALRLNGRGDWGPLAFQADYQLLGVSGDQVALNRAFADPALARPVLPLDDLRWLDLSQTVHDGDRSEVVQRLDRLQLGWTGSRTTLRVGRQAVSWGNGLFYQPMDVFNPFDPAAIDTEYKLGDDMIYGQQLLDSGSDWQGVVVQRRDFSGKAGTANRSYALKYHGFGSRREYDLLLASHYEQTLLGIGGSSNLGDAVVRADLVLADTSAGWTATAVFNGSWSWVAGGRNMSGSVEYFYNGFGLRQDDYSGAGFLGAPELLARLRRGELFTLGRHYLAASVQVEMTPLVNMTPSLFVNLGDQSALAQLALSWDLRQNWQLLGAANVPVGPRGTEFGGLALAALSANATLAQGPSLLLQIARYF